MGYGDRPSAAGPVGVGGGGDYGSAYSSEPPSSDQYYSSFSDAPPPPDRGLGGGYGAGEFFGRGMDGNGAS